MHSRARSEQGFGTLALLLLITGVLFMTSLIFAIWAFAGFLDYKNNFDAKVAQRVTIAKDAEAKAKDAEFAETAKLPLRTYVGPSAYGSVTIKYPKTWSGYVRDTSAGSPYVDGYFYPGIVPDTQGTGSVFALRVQVIANSYSSELNGFSGYVKQGLTKVSPYKSPKVPSVIGARVTGRLTGTKDGTMVIIPLRNMTLELWTESTAFQKDFDNKILPNFSFAP